MNARKSFSSKRPGRAAGRPSPELVRRHERRVHGVALRMAGNVSDADDLAQEVFLTAWKAIASFRRGSSFYTWLYRIAVNTSLTFLEEEGPGEEPGPVRREPVSSERRTGDSRAGLRRARP